jgi:hypothetical protein
MTAESQENGYLRANYKFQDTCLPLISQRNGSVPEDQLSQLQKQGELIFLSH